MPVVLLALAGCAKQGDMAADAGAPAAEAAVASPEGAFLAYEHDVQVQLEAAKIAPRIQQIAQACQSAKFGDCAVLQVDQRSGEQPSGEVKVRIAPKGAEPLIAMAGEGGTLQSRTTRAEDLAQAVADTALTKARLEKEHARLLSYQDRKDLKIEDLMAITTRLSEIEAGVEQANKDAAQQRRRIDTQLVTLHFETTSGQRSRSEIGEALSESGGILGSSIAFLIRAVAALLPVGVLALVVAWGPARGGVAAAARCRPTSEVKADAGRRPASALVGLVLDEHIQLQRQLLHGVAYLLRGAFIADFHFQLMDAGADVVGQPGRTGIVVVHVWHQVVDFLDMFDAVQAEQQVADGTGVVFGSGDAQSQHGHGVGTLWRCTQPSQHRAKNG